MFLEVPNCQEHLAGQADLEDLASLLVLGFLWTQFALLVRESLEYK